MNRAFLLTFLAITTKCAIGQWTTSGTDIYSSNTGNVGVGTTSPSTKLEVSGEIKQTGRTTYLWGAGSNQNQALMFAGWGFAHGGIYWRGDTKTFTLNTGNDADNLGQYGNANLVVTGSVGIGITNPSAILDVADGNAHMQFASGGSAGIGEIFRMWGPNGMAFSTNSYTPSSGNLITDLGVNYSIDGSNGTSKYARIGSKKAPIIRLNAEDGSIALYGESGSGNDFRTPTHNLGLIVQSGGNVAIGANDAQGYKLAVNGDAIFTKVRVKTYATWPDYVFHSTYKLPSLQELEKYIQKNNHLPEVPSASDVEKDGLDLGGNQALLLKKIEELTLYIIEQDKTIKDQNNKINDLQSMNKKLEEQSKSIEDLTKQVKALRSLLNNK